MTDLVTFYNIDLGTTPSHIAYNGIVRTGIRFDAGASGLNTSIKSVLLFQENTEILRVALLWALGKHQMIL